MKKDEKSEKCEEKMRKDVKKDEKRNRKWEIMCRYFLGNKCDKMWNKIENDRNDRKDEKDRNAKMMKKGHKMSIFHEKDGYLRVPFPDV